MFTGLVEGRGTVVHLVPGGQDLRLGIRASFDTGGFSVGESVNVDGACLTVIACQGNTFTADVSRETVQRTTIARWRQGQEVNLERALRLGDRLGGHLVSGHVDGVARVAVREKRGESLVITFETQEELSRYLIEKGSVAVNGVSLTVNRCQRRRFEVNVVPHTARVTTLGELGPGDQVNIEVDLIGKYVEKFVRNLHEEHPQGKVDREFLARYGFL